MPLVTTGIFIAVALSWAWLSDGPFRGRRYPFIYFGAIVTVSFETLRTIFDFPPRLLTSTSLPQLLFSVVLRQMPLYKNIHGRKVVYWLSQFGVSLPS